MAYRPVRIEPGSGQESVWDYSRPPRLESVSARLRVVFSDETVADTVRGYRVLETSHPPVYYFPPSDIRWGLVVAESGSSFCEFKGGASYWSVEVENRRAEKAAWSYAEPTRPFRQIKDYLAFYASRVDACWVAEERVLPQDGDFYGGWITARIVGPFKGRPETRGW